MVEDTGRVRLLVTNRGEKKIDGIKDSIQSVKLQTPEKLYQKRLSFNRKALPRPLSLPLIIAPAIHDLSPSSPSRTLQVLRYTSHWLPFNAQLSGLIRSLGNSRIRAT